MSAVEKYLKKRKRGWNMDVDGTLHLAVRDAKVDRWSEAS